MFEDKIISGNIEKLTLKEIDGFIDENWLLWTSRFNLNPCGHLTLVGKKRYIENNIEEVKKLIGFNKEN